MHSLKLVGSLAGVTPWGLKLSLVKLIHILGCLKTCLWHVGGRCGRQKKKEMCIVRNPGRSIKLETIRGRFLIDLLKFCFSFNEC